MTEGAGGSGSRASRLARRWLRQQTGPGCRAFLTNRCEKSTHGVPRNISIVEILNKNGKLFDNDPAPGPQSVPPSIATMREAA